MFYGMLNVSFVAMTFFRATCELPDGIFTSALQIPNKEIDKGQAHAQEGLNITKAIAYSSAVEIAIGVRCKRIGNACA